MCTVLTSEHAENDASWKRLAADGEIVQAIRIHRALFGTGLKDAQTQVLAYRAELPADQRFETIELSENEAIAKLKELCPRLSTEIDAGEMRVVNKALKVLDGQVRHRFDRQGVKTGPKPPKPQWAGHHWLKVYDCDGHYHGTQVMFWQPGAQAWCHSGMYAANADVNTEFWRYHAECPMPE